MAHSKDGDPNASVQPANSFCAENGPQSANRPTCGAGCVYVADLALDLELGFDRIDRMARDAC